MNYHFGSVARKVLAEAPTNTSKPEGTINSDYYLSFIPKKKEPFKFKEITPEQIIQWVSKMKNRKSGKIPTMFVKDTIEVTAPILSVIFNKSTSTPVIARVFEKLIHEQLLPYFNDYLHKNQLGFRPKYSTQSALLNTTNQWLLNIDNRNLNLAVFLDLRKAFDTVDHNVLIQKLEYDGIQGIELKWFKSYLGGRQ